MTETDEISHKSNSSSIPWQYDINQEDTNWIITSAFMIFTMQTGRGTG